MITLLPFNIFHHHVEDEHRMALAAHTEGHSCELDERFCQDAFSGDCKHESHIGTPDAKCFSCQFHFEKHYALAAALQAPVQVSYAQQHAPLIVHAAIRAAQLISNKGPPQLS